MHTHIQLRIRLLKYVALSDLFVNKCKTPQMPYISLGHVCMAKQCHHPKRLLLSLTFSLLSSLFNIQFIIASVQSIDFLKVAPTNCHIAFFTIYRQDSCFIPIHNMFYNVSIFTNQYNGTMEI